MAARRRGERGEKGAGGRAGPRRAGGGMTAPPGGTGRHAARGGNGKEVPATSPPLGDPGRGGPPSPDGAPPRAQGWGLGAGGGDPHPDRDSQSPPRAKGQAGSARLQTPPRSALAQGRRPSPLRSSRPSPLRSSRVQAVGGGAESPRI